MTETNASGGLATRLSLAFAAGFLATVIFHQLALMLLWSLGIAPFPPFQMAGTAPLGVPAFVSLAFWGGVWGIAFAWAERHFPGGTAYWVTAFLFGAILPSMAALVVVLPLKGRPPGGGWQPALLSTALLINGAWGIGTAWILRDIRGKEG